MAKKKSNTKIADGYGSLLTNVASLLEQSRRSSARAVNHVLTATYWELGRQIVEHEQGGEDRADYGTELLNRLSYDLRKRFGRGYSARNLRQMRAFYDGWEIWQTLSAKFEARVALVLTSFDSGSNLQTVSAISGICQTPSGKLTTFEGTDIFQTPSGISEISPTVSAKSDIRSTASSKSQIAQTPSAQFNSSLLTAFPLSWSQYVRLMSVEKPHARAFYESEAINGGWSVRQLDRQISTQFFERASTAKQQAAILARGQKAQPDDILLPDDEIRDPYLLEFLNLKDEYSESDLEEALVKHIEAFMLELGAGFTFVARQKRIRIGTEWYRIDLLLYHRRLRCLVVIDLKLGKYTHSDAGQMSLYLTYAREHLMESGENEPVGIILCSDKDDAVVHYSMGSINARVFASKYMTELPDVETLQREIALTKRTLIERRDFNSQTVPQRDPQHSSALVVKSKNETSKKTKPKTATKGKR